jgi:signal transduction histidine kinase
MPDVARAGHPTRVQQALRLLADDDRKASAALAGSQRHLMQTADRARRTIERDLHDGAQQRFVSLDLTLQMAERLLGRGETAEGVAVLQEAMDGLEAGLLELAQLARGLEPVALRNEGLAPALEDLVSQSGVSVALSVSALPALDPAVETAAYFLVSEALTNVLKHACADHVTVAVDVQREHLQVIIADNGRGGANCGGGSGLRGLSDRVNALGGRFQFDSPRRGGTVLTARLPARHR